MGTTVQGYCGSQLHCEAEQIVIRLPRQVFGEAWTDLRTRLLEAMGQQQVIPSPQRVMTERGEGEDAPRWKPMSIDVLSWVLFLLKVPAGHELVVLWQVIPWATINQLCAPLYRNAHGGRLAWAPAQMVAILMLMFLYGVAYETRTLAWVKENVVWCWFCGFGFFGPWPNRNALYDFRQRVGPELFEEVLTLAVWACVEARLVNNLLVSFDLGCSLGASLESLRAGGDSDQGADSLPGVVLGRAATGRAYARCVAQVGRRSGSGGSASQGTGAGQAGTGGRKRGPVG